jgi:hypothetical protein
MSSLEPSVDNERLDQLSLESALLDVEVANARVADLTARLLELSAELRDARKEAHALSLENAELQEALDALRSNKAYKTAERVWQLRRGLGL